MSWNGFASLPQVDELMEQRRRKRWRRSTSVDDLLDIDDEASRTGAECQRSAKIDSPWESSNVRITQGSVFRERRQPEHEFGEDDPAAQRPAGRACMSTAASRRTFMPASWFVAANIVHLWEAGRRQYHPRRRDAARERARIETDLTSNPLHVRATLDVHRQRSTRRAGCGRTANQDRRIGRFLA
jgi:hypothetical protein